MIVARLFWQEIVQSDYKGKEIEYADRRDRTGS